jgi:hypothetical protein
VHVCVSGGHVVLLDVNADRYLALEWSQAVTLSAFIRGWPVRATPDIPPDEKLLQELVRRSLLTRDAGAGKDATPVAIRRPSSDLPLAGSWRAPRAKEMLGAGGAIVRAAAMRWLPLSRVIRHVRRRRRLVVTASRSSIDETRRLVHTFDWVRPFLFSARDACFLDSLALLQFLASRDIYPLWVFGVRMKPFAAHCWLQHEGSVLTDSVERVSSFTPIMTV